MDTGRGNFAMLSQDKYDELAQKKANGLFREGEIIKIKNSSFKLKKINENGEITLKLLDENENKEVKKMTLEEEMEKDRLRSMQKERNIFNKGKIH